MLLSFSALWGVLPPYWLSKNYRLKFLIVFSRKNFVLDLLLLIPRPASCGILGFKGAQMAGFFRMFVPQREFFVVCCYFFG